MDIISRGRARELIATLRRRPLERPEADELLKCVEACERQRERDALAAARRECDRLMRRLRRS